MLFGLRSPSRTLRPGGKRLNHRVGCRLEALEERTLFAADSGFGEIGLATASPEPIASPLAVPVTLIAPVNDAITSATQRNAQSKVWQHDGDWWTVFYTSAGPSAGTWVYRLDGSAWQPIVRIATKLFTADVKPVGNGDVTYVFLYSGTVSSLAKLTFTGGTYKLTPLVSATTPLATVPLGESPESGSMDIDSRNRMWVAYDTTSTVEVRWADAPYTSWSAPIVLATVKVDDSAAIISFSGKIGVLWSNQNTQRFGFRVHVDGASPTAFSADEVPAAASAHNVGSGMADDHLNIKAASDGTLYAAVKTGYDEGEIANPEMALIVRRPNGKWDPLYGIDGNGTRGILELNESDGFLRYIYNGETGLNDIVFKDLPLAAIKASTPDRFYSGPDVSSPLYARQLLLGGGLNKNPSSTKQAFTKELVVVATRSADATDLNSHSVVGGMIPNGQFGPSNSAPVNTVPGGQVGLMNSPVVFSGANGNAIAVFDKDIGNDTLTVTLKASKGTLKLLSSAGLSSVSGDGTATLVITGTMAAVNAAFEGLQFRPKSNFEGAGLLTVITNDQGNTGLGGDQSDRDEIAIELSSHPWMNVDLPEDVTGEGNLSPQDAFKIINELLAKGVYVLPPPPPGGVPLHFDVNGDNKVSQSDVLKVINKLLTLTTAASPLALAADQPAGEELDAHAYLLAGSPGQLTGVAGMVPAGGVIDTPATTSSRSDAEVLPLPTALEKPVPATRPRQLLATPKAHDVTFRRRANVAIRSR